jgi:hypothetical protein
MRIIAIKSCCVDLRFEFTIAVIVVDVVVVVVVAVPRICRALPSSRQLLCPTTVSKSM